MGGEDGFEKTLVNKEIAEVESPESPGGQAMYRYTVYIASEGTTRKKVAQQDKDKVMDPMELDFAFDEVPLGWQLKASSNALADMAAGQKSAIRRLESNASGSNEPLAPVPMPKEFLPIEDAKEKDKLLIKAEEAVKGNASRLLKARKILRTLPATALAKKHCQNLEEIKAAVEEFSAKLETIAIDVTLPGDPQPVPLATLKDLLKDSWAHSKDLSQARIMAQALMPKKAQPGRDD